MKLAVVSRRVPLRLPSRLTSSGGGDGVTKLPCAILLHELTHAYEKYVGPHLRLREFEPMRMEN